MTDDLNAVDASEMDHLAARLVNGKLGGASVESAVDLGRIEKAVREILIAIGEDRARWFDREPERFEFQMLYGVRPDEQLRLSREGYTTRVYVPYGTQWYGYLMRRLAERPANISFFARALVSKK